jgi:hypothetical protein
MRYVANIIETYITLNMNVLCAESSQPLVEERCKYMKAVGSLETLVPTIQITCCHISDHSNLYTYCRDDFISQNLK